MNKTLKTLISLCLFSGLSTAAFSAEKYETGVNSTITKQGNILVEVHNSGILNKLWYRLGVLKNNHVTWGKSYYYDQGKDPSVAIYNNTVVEVHESEFNDTLWYHVGTLDTENMTITWGDSHFYEYGLRPKISMNQDVIVETHQYNEYNFGLALGINNSNISTSIHVFNHLFYKTGVVNNETKTIDWVYQNSYASGTSPTVVIQGDKVIEAHNKGPEIWSSVGVLNNHIIQWQSFKLLGRGSQTSLAIEDELVVEMHTSEFFNRLWYHVGKLNSEKNIITWSPSTRYDRGVRPSILLEKGTLMEVHTADYLFNLYQNIGIIDKEKSTIQWNNSKAHVYYTSKKQ